MQIYPVVPIMLLYQGCPHNASIPGMFWFLKRGSQDAIKDQIVNICLIIEKQESFRKISTSALLTMTKPLIVCTTTNCGKF